MVHDEIDRRSRQIEVLLTASIRLAVHAGYGVRILQQVSAIQGVNLLNFILSGEIDHHASGFALHRLGSSLLDMNISRQDRRMQQVFSTRQQELSLIRTPVDFLVCSRTISLPRSLC